MKQIKGNLWDLHKKGKWITIPTNGSYKATGEAVMGAGLALEAKIKFPHLPIVLGENLSDVGNLPWFFERYRLVTFPTKKSYTDSSADLSLIKNSCKVLVARMDMFKITSLYMPRVGCGCGRLSWPVVEALLVNYLDDRFTVVSLNGY